MLDNNENTPLPNDSLTESEHTAANSENSAQAKENSRAESIRKRKEKIQHAKQNRKLRKEQIALRKKERRELRQKQKEERAQKAELALSDEVKLERKLLQLANTQRDNRKWYKLDNAALVYPLTARKESISVFRLSVLMKEEVDPITLQLAVNDVVARFPTICGCVKSGWFWPFIDKPSTPILVKKQTKVPGRPMKLDSRRSQIRVNYFGKQIAVEFFHSATDGNGGIVFLNSLVRRYLQLKGYNTDTINCFDYRDLPTLDEIRDNFSRIAVKKNPPSCPKNVKSTQINGTLLPNKRYMTMRAVCSAEQLHNVAKRYNATVTEFIGALQLMSLAKLIEMTGSKNDNPIRILVPVNLRKRYGVETVRNFSNYIFYQYNGQDNLTDVILDVQQQAKEQLTDEYFAGMVSFNYNSGQHPLLKIVPYGLKSLILKSVVKNVGDGVLNCSTLSNLGVIVAPTEFKDHVLRYDFMLGKPAKNTVNFTIATYNNVCVITQTNPFAEKDCERHFFRTLSNLGVDLAMESDIWEETR